MDEPTCYGCDDETADGGAIRMCGTCDTGDGKGGDTAWTCKDDKYSSFKIHSTLNYQGCQVWVKPTTTCQKLVSSGVAHKPIYNHYGQSLAGRVTRHGKDIGPRYPPDLKVECDCALTGTCGCDLPDSKKNAGERDHVGNAWRYRLLTKWG